MKTLLHIEYSTYLLPSEVDLTALCTVLRGMRRVDRQFSPNAYTFAKSTPTISIDFVPDELFMHKDAYEALKTKGEENDNKKRTA